MKEGAHRTRMDLNKKIIVTKVGTLIVTSQRVPQDQGEPPKGSKWPLIKIP